MAGAAGRLMDTRTDIEVWAAGGVVHRSGEAGPEFLLVHRPRHNDWSFPKGKLDESETLKECAIREVQEETGLLCTPGKKLPMIEYRDAHRRRKAVLYWTMTVIDGTFMPNDEVDSVGWFDRESATTILTYRHDADLLARIDLRTMRPKVAR